MLEKINKIIEAEIAKFTIPQILEINIVEYKNLRLNALWMEYINVNKIRIFK